MKVLHCWWRGASGSGLAMATALSATVGGLEKPLSSLRMPLLPLLLGGDALLLDERPYLLANCLCLGRDLEVDHLHPPGICGQLVSGSCAGRRWTRMETG